MPTPDACSKSASVSYPLQLLDYSHEKNISTQCNQVQAYPRVSCTHENPWWTLGYQASSRQRPNAPGFLNLILIGHPAILHSALRLSPPDHDHDGEGIGETAGKVVGGVRPARRFTAHHRLLKPAEYELVFNESGHVPRKTPGQTPRNVTAQAPRNIPAQAPQNITGQMPQNIPAQASANVTAQSSRNAPRTGQAGYYSSSGGIMMRARKNGANLPRLGLIISKKSIKHAVGRNRVKRLTRESFRLGQARLGGLDVVVMSRAGVGELSNPKLRAVLDKHWDALARWMERWKPER